MTNPTDLLPRFAAASEWLAEHHPDAPRLPGWIDLEAGHIDNARDPSYGTVNPAACLSGAVVWAMEVAWGYAAKCNAMIRFTVGYHGCHIWILVGPDNTVLLSGETNEGNEVAWLMFLESICESLGREG